MSTLSSNPKQVNRVTRYAPNLQRTLAVNAAVAAAGPDAPIDTAATAEEPQADWLALASLMLGVVGLMMRYKLCAWAALFTCLSSVSNLRHRDRDIKQIICSITFAVMGLIMNYFGVRQPPGGGGATVGLPA